MSFKHPLLRALVCLAIVPLLLVGGCGSKKSSTAASTAAATVATAAASATAASDNGDVDLTCPTSNTTSFAKTKFATHAAAATGAFRHWIYKPYKAGTFAKGAHGRVVGFVKAGAAALFVKHELRLTAEDAKASPALCKAIAKPLSDLANKITGVVSKAKGGDLSGIDGLNTDTNSLLAGADKSGDKVTPNENANIANLSDPN
ncbi:hypothetical protein [Tsukamurella soli]|uniref:Lipoprotein n=1 Tax=Tsukamurella soli TaxID=644556 RepID=A0ABP8K5H2_9ACTN